MRRSSILLAALAVVAVAAFGGLRGSAAALGLVAWAQSAKGPVNIDAAGIANGGHDVVAYFKQGRAVAGQASITAVHAGATYRFASAENRDAFLADPAAYLPQYGGYCAYGMASGYKVEVDPTVWRIVDGKLYLNYSRSVGERWARDIPGFIATADAKWPAIR